MPIPFLIAGLGVAAGLVGAGAHLSAKETNEQAVELSNKAQRMYDETKESLEVAQKKTEQSLLKLGYSKKHVLETSIEQFLRAYERIKNIQLSESAGLNEVAKLTINHEETLKLREMSSIYQSTFSSAATGAATGAVVALAASGYMPIVTGTLSVAGSFLAVGEIGAAASIAGSALSFGASMTPLAAIAAPVVLFTGISSSIKAEENLEKARATYAEAERAVESMKTSITVCDAISKKSEMFDNLLGKLNPMFSTCTTLLDGMTAKKVGPFKRGVIKAEDLTEDELKLVAVTRALAGAVKAVIDTPLLDEKGKVSAEAKKTYEETVKQLPLLTNEVNAIKQIKYDTKPVREVKATGVRKKSRVGENVRNFFALFMGWVAFSIFSGVPIVGLFAGSVVSLLIMKHDCVSTFFTFVRKALGWVLTAIMVMLFYYTCPLIVLYVDFYVLKCLIVGAVAFALFAVLLPGKTGVNGAVKKTFCAISGSVFLACVGVLIFALLFDLLGITWIFLYWLLTAAYAICVWFTVGFLAEIIFE